MHFRHSAAFEISAVILITIILSVAYTSCSPSGKDLVDPGIPLPVVELRKDSTVTTFDYLALLKERLM